MSSSYGLLGYPSDWAINYGAAAIPPDYFLPTITQGFRVTRRKIKRDVDTAMPITPSQPIVRWKIPSASATIIDFRRATVFINFSTAVTGGPTTMASNLAWNLFDRVRLEQAGNYVEDRRYFNWQETFFYVMMTHFMQQITTGVALYGAGSQITRTAHAGGWRYGLPFPFTGLTKGVLPFFQLSKDGLGIMPMNQQDLILQWEIANPLTWIEQNTAGGTGLTYTITKMEVEYDELSIEGGPASFVSKWFESANKCPQVLFKSILSNIYPLSTSTEQDVLIDLKVQSLIALYATFRDGGNISNPVNYDKFETFLPPTTTMLSSYQWEVNGVLWPDKIIPTSSTYNIESYVNFEQTMQIFHSRRINEEVTPITMYQWVGDKFVMCFDGNPHPFTMNLLSPLSTQKGNTQIHLRLQFSSAPPANLQLIVHAHHYKIWNYNCYAAKGLIVEN
jgi:hypothetical protein